MLRCRTVSLGGALRLVAVLLFFLPDCLATDAVLSLESGPSILLSGMPARFHFKVVASFSQPANLYLEAIGSEIVWAKEQVYAPSGLSEQSVELAVAVSSASTAELVFRLCSLNSTVLDSHHKDGIRVIPAFTSLLPIACILAIVVATANVFSGLLVGLYVAGVLISPGYNPFTGMIRLGDTLLYNGISQSSTATILFLFISSGLTAVITKNGGCHGLCNALRPLATSRERAQLIAIGTAILSLMGGFFSVMLVGSVMGPISRLRGVSRAKLAFVLDSTSAPISALSFCSPWTGFKIGAVQQQLTALHIEDSALSVIARAVPYSFFPMLAIAFAILIAATGRDYGPMLAAEAAPAGRGSRGERGTGDDSSDEDEESTGQRRANDGGMAALMPDPNKPQRLANAAAPMLVLILALAYGVWESGVEGWRERHRSDGAVPTAIDIVASANVIKVLLWASVAATVAAVAVTRAQGLLSLNECVEAFLQGCANVVPGVMMLVLTFTVGHTARLLHVGPYIVSLVGDNLPLGMVPPIGFLLAAFISATSGSSWGAMSIVYPILLPLAARDGGGEAGGHSGAGELLVQTVAAGLSGAVLGDQISPVSDTTVLSAIFAECALMEHVWTQAAYSGTVAVVSVAAFWLAAAGQVPSLVCAGLGFGVLSLVLYTVGKRPEEAGGARSDGCGGDSDAATVTTNVTAGTRLRGGRFWRWGRWGGYGQRGPPSEDNSEEGKSMVERGYHGRGEDAGERQVRVTGGETLAGHRV